MKTRQNVIMYLVLFIIFFSFTQLFSQANMPDFSGSWKIITDVDGSKFKTNVEGYVAANSMGLLIKINSDKSIQPEKPNNNANSINIIFNSFTITQNLCTINYSLTTGETFTDTFEITWENNYSNVTGILKTSTNTKRNILIGKYKVYAVKQ
jgi:hypothetical protein